MYVRNWFRILVLCQADSQLNFRPSTRRFILCLLIWKISKRYDVIESFPWLFIAYSVYCSCSLKWKIASFWKCWKLIFYCFFVVNAVFLDVVGGIEWKGFWRHFYFYFVYVFLVCGDWVCGGDEDIATILWLCCVCLRGRSMGTIIAVTNVKCGNLLNLHHTCDFYAS